MVKGSLHNQRLSKLLLTGTGTMMGFAVLQQNWFYLAALFGLFLVVLWPVQVALGSFAFLVPFDSSSGLGGEAGGISLTFVAGMIAAMILVGLGMAFRRFQPPATPALWWLLFVLWAAASTVWAYDQEAAIHRLPTMFSLFLFYLVASSFRMNEKEFSAIVALTVSGGCAAALVSIYEFYHGTSLHGMRGSLMIGDRFTDPNIFAASLLLPFSLSAGEFLASASLRRKILTLLVSGVIALGIFITMSRGALLALGVMLLVYLRKLRIGWRLLVPAAVLLVGLAIAPKTLFQRLAQSDSNGGAARLYIWKAGLAAFKEFAAVGAGLNNFAVIYSRFRADPRDAGNSNPLGVSQRDSHNIYLETAVELGTVGLALLFMALVSQLRTAHRASSALRDGPASLRAIACQAAAWGMLAASFFLGMLWFKAFWLVWIMLAQASSERAGSTTSTISSTCPHPSPLLSGGGAG